MSRSLDRDGIGSIFSLIALTDKDIDNLAYLPVQRTGDLVTPILLHIHAGDRGLLRQLQAWLVFVRLLNLGGQPLTLEDYEELDADVFDEFRISNAVTNANNRSNQVSSSSSSNTASTPGSNSSSRYSAHHNFKKSIRRDSNVYPVLKDDKHYNNWNRSVISQARAHDVIDVFDSDYTPKTIDAILLFKEKQSFVYSMFNRCVQTDSGKAITDLPTAKLDSSWRGTHEGFILMWKEKMRLLEDMTPTHHHYAPEIKSSMLENSVSVVSKLNNVKDISNNLVAVGNPPLTYNAYSQLLISACNQLDKLNEVPKKRSKRHVN